MMSDARQKYEAVREVLSGWAHHDLESVIRDAYLDNQTLIEIILDNDLIDIDETLREAGRATEDGSLVRLCGGAKTASEERELYEKAMKEAEQR